MTGAPLRFPWAEAPGIGQAIEIAEGVLWMRVPLPIIPDHINIFAFDDGDGWTVIDTGFDTGDGRVAWQALLSGPLKGKPVNRLLCTHHHPDHIGLAGWFQTELGATLMMSRTAWYFARMRVLDVQDTATPEDIAFWRAAGMPPEMLAERMAGRPMNYSDTVAPMPMGFFRLREGDTLRMGGRNWTVRLVHGHAPSQITLWSADDNLVLGADHLLPGASASLSVYSTEPEADPVAEFLSSCERTRAFVRDDQLILPGHGLPFEGGAQRLERMIRNRKARLTRLLGHLDTPQTVCSSFSPLFKRRMTGPLYGHALVETVGHLNHLHQSGQVVRWRREDGAWLWQRREARDG